MEGQNMHKRPNSRAPNFPDNDFMMDFENACLKDWSGNLPKGKHRFEDAKWKEHILRQVYPNHSDVDFWEYRAWCLAGYGDEWFQEEVS
jgi:hypothetical protein